MLATAIFAVADFHLNRPLLFYLWGLKLLGLIVAAAVFRLSLRVRTRRALIGAALLGAGSAMGLTAVAGVVAGDPTTTPLVCAAIALISATTLPWGLAAQGATVAIGVASIVAQTYALQSPFGYPPLAGLVTVCLSLYVAYAYARQHTDLQRQRQRAAAAHHAFEESEERFRVTFDQAAVGIAHVAPDGRWLRVNSQLCAIVGYSAAELLTRTFQDITHPDDLAADLGYVERMLDGSLTTYSMEKRYLRKDQQTVWVNLTVSLVRDREHRPRYFISVVEDITARKRADERIQALNAALRARSLALEDANREMEAFSYSVSHDLRTPLRAIEGFSRMLLEDHAAPLAADARRHLERIGAASERMQHLIDDLLLLGQINRREMFRRAVDISGLARAVAADLRESAPARRTEVIIAPGLRATADPNLIRIVLDNLLGNAWKYTAKRPTGRIEVGASGEPGAPAFFVRDDGAGFDMTYADRLFRPFQRLHSNEDFEGTGIGLAIVARIVRRHGGRVWAEATPDHGATFYFTLAPAEADSAVEDVAALRAGAA